LSSVLAIREALGERTIREADLPLSIGGEGCDIVIAAAGEGALAHLGIHDGELFIQPAGELPVLVNGAPVQRSAWLHVDDVADIGAARLRLGDAAGQRVLTVEDGSQGNITAPPLVTAQARISGSAQDDEEAIEAISFRTPAAAQTHRKRFPIARSIAFGILVVLAALAWFVFTGTSVQVASEPPAQTIDFDGTLPALEIGGRFLMRPGKYDLRLEREGYVPVETAVEIAHASSQRLEYTLEKLPGILRVEVPAPAQIEVDGEVRGTAPGDFELRPGRHTVRVTSERYLDFAADVEIEGEQRVQTFAPQLEPAWAAVTVASEPAGAEVRVDGEAVGITPLVTDVIAGHRKLELALKGYKTWQSDLQIRPSQPVEIGPVRLGLPDGHLTVRTRPAGASVTIAGAYRGTTPLELEVRPEIAQSIVVAKPGYESARRELKLAPGEARTLNLDLTGIVGRVTVRAQPADAELFIDGEPRGKPDQSFDLIATRHVIEIRKDGFETFRKEVTPRPGLPQVIETRLLTPRQAQIAALPASVVTKAGEQLKLMPVGQFTMGSSRREPGRRANEAQRAIALERRFYLAVRPVTNAAFRQFVAEHRSGFVGPNTLELERQPVVKVSWQDAAGYCNWLSQQDGLPGAYVKQGGQFVPVTPANTGYRLPTEAEWEFVARYVDASTFKRYPWGDALPVAPRSGNFADLSARAILSKVISDYDDGYPVTSPVGSFPGTVLGVFDLGSNVAEWAHDYYTVGAPPGAVAKDPMGPEKGNQHVIRGASWRSSSVTELRLMSRAFGDGARDDVGFRIARYAE
jgi:formylglycine-generating enzyme required for sulfatase activity